MPPTKSGSLPRTGPERGTARKPGLPGGHFHGGMRGVNIKALALLTLLPLPLAKGALIANIITDKGTVQVDLQYAKTPKTVANFITMAQATRSRLDLATGKVISKPLYIGEKFYRVENTSTFKIIQTGSGTGDTTGVPGFTIKEEFDPTLTHVPYVMAMANAGPNTSSGQIYLTGNVTLTSLDNSYTVFGLITDTPSRAVIDAILAAGKNTTTITNVTFSRTDGAAQAFNELAQDLPTITVPTGALAVQPGTSARWNFTTPLGTGAVFRAFRSNTLATGSWAELESAAQQVGIGPVGSPPTLASAQLDTAATPKAFYRLSVANHPGAVAPTSLANRTVTTVVPGTGTFVYAFGADGASGLLTFTPTSGTVKSGNFLTYDPASIATAPAYSLGAHDINFDAFSETAGIPEIWMKIGCDSANSTQISGHASTSFWNGGGWAPLAPGTSTITR